MLKHSVLLSTGFAVAIIVSVPLMGGAGVAVGAADQPAGSIVIAAASPASILSSPALTRASTASADSQPASDSDSTAGSTTSAPAVVSDATVAHPVTVKSVIVKSVPPVRATFEARASNLAASHGISSTGTTASVPRPAAPAVKPVAPKAAPVTKVCPSAIGGSPSTVPGNIVSGEGVQGTTNADLASFSLQYNATRVANCLPPIALTHIRYDACLQARMFWIAEDPSTNPASAWGHDVPRSDGKPIVGCDGDIAGGNGDTGATAADKWWESPDHRASLYQPAWGNESYANVCIGFAISHGGIPNDPASFSRESAVWETC